MNFVVVVKGVDVGLFVCFYVIRVLSGCGCLLFMDLNSIVVDHWCCFLQLFFASKYGCIYLFYCALF